MCGKDEEVLLVYVVNAGVKLYKVGYLSQHLYCYNGHTAVINNVYSGDVTVCANATKHFQLKVAQQQWMQCGNNSSWHVEHVCMIMLFIII